MISVYEANIGGRTLQFEVGRLANLSQGALTVRTGDTIVLGTANASKSPRAGADFLPLTVDCEEKMYAAGKIPGSFFKREGRPTTDAILIARLTDRPIRPLFPKGFFYEVQLIQTILSVDMENAPDVLSIIAASAALTMSSIPFDDPIGACRIGYIDGEYVVNPTYAERENSTLDLIVAGTADAIMMVEAGANEVSEDVLVGALKLSQEINGQVVDLIRKLQSEVGKEKWTLEVDSTYDETLEAARNFLGSRLYDSLAEGGDKQTQRERLDGLKAELTEALGEEHDGDHLKRSFDDIETDAVREGILKEGRRPDGRSLDEIRPLSSSVGYLPRAHGCGIFTRGETQIMSILTLGSTGEAQRLDSLSPQTSKSFMHHYNFPPFSVGEVRRLGTGRREIGHGILAERAVQLMIPSKEEFPYTIRIVSEALSSNGSTSMASVCASTLALMDAGVPIKKPVAGIAMGLITGENGETAILTDIQGAEDHSGDMDFKVAGTPDGVTALQMDIKVKGITFEIMGEALAQARKARMEIIDHMLGTISEPRAEMSQYAPRMITIKIPTDKIGAIIGPGGKVIRGMIEEFGVTIDVSDDGTVVVGATDGEAGEKVRDQIDRMTRDLTVGDRFKGKVVRLMAFGAFVELLPGKDGLVHISELADHRVESVESVVEIGDELEVEVIEIDRMGRVNLTANLRDGDNGSRSGKAGRDDDDFGDDETRDRRPPSFDRDRGGDRNRGPRRQVGSYSGGGGGRGRDRSPGGSGGDRRRRPPRRD
ncbi:MAG: polyribonucleotide nucleotidyltransferase [Chloroflexi bacterium]|nr:polyribonucleotide nucleotidyltransferase [Chloroflexota bacterium]